MKKIILSIIILAILQACHRPIYISSKSGEVLMVDSSLDVIQDSLYLSYLAPIKLDLESKLGAPIGYAPKALEVYQPECPMLNWASDALLAMARNICPERVDVAIVNIGGMRCNWGAGDITFEHVFELMPFDNELVVLTLSGEDIFSLCEIFAKGGGEGIAGMRMVAKNNKVLSVTVDGKEIVLDAYYTVATSDYLSQGNDGMLPLKNSIAVWKSDKKIRDLYIEYIHQVKKVESKVDGRMKLL